MLNLSLPDFKLGCLFNQFIRWFPPLFNVPTIKKEGRHLNPNLTDSITHSPASGVNEEQYSFKERELSECCARVKRARSWIILGLCLILLLLSNVVLLDFSVTSWSDFILIVWLSSTTWLLFSNFVFCPVDPVLLTFMSVDFHSDDKSFEAHSGSRSPCTWDSLCSE